MSKRTVFTTITPLPADISRQTVIDFLHSHLDMIDLNPLVTERHPINPPSHAGADEQHCVWYSLTDKVDVLGKSNSVSYTCAFNNLPKGLQTHCYAPMGLDIRDRWTVGGSLPGEPAEPVELGLGAPAMGLYVREDVEMRCNVLMAGFVKKTLKKSHAELVEKLKVRASVVSAARHQQQRPLQVSRPQTRSSFDKPLPVPPPHTPSWGSSHSFPQGVCAANQHHQMNPTMNQQPVRSQGLSVAEQWVQQQRQEQLMCQGSMLNQPTMYRVPTIQQADTVPEPPSAFPEPLRIHRSQGSFSSSVSSAFAAISGPSSSVSSQGSYPLPPPTPPQQSLRPAPSVVRWAGAKDKDYSEFGANPYSEDGLGLAARQPTVRPGARVVVKAQQSHVGVQQGQQGRQTFVAELE